MSPTYGEPRGPTTNDALGEDGNELELAQMGKELLVGCDIPQTAEFLLQLATQLLVLLCRQRFRLNGREHLEGE